MVDLTMGNPDAVSVDPEEVRNHATSLETLMTSLTMSLEAASYLGSADDGFGTYPRPLVKMVFDDDQRGMVDALRKLSETVAALPDNLKTVATTFEDVDGKIATSLAELQEQIRNSSGAR
ncbi:WXG100 family type VII secretion target [Nocardia sp. bgisy118]|uniref:WXG100 family type VII secretion target n=1 Tax=Nocardia sp. bgisy118 TaxID=3413786 RepID=UPI003F4A1955